MNFLRSIKLRDPNGFTLVELMVSMGIGMVILAAVTTTFMSQTRIYNAQEQINEMQQNARGALDILSRELKMAGYKPNGGGFNGVTYSTTQLRVQADLNSDGAISTSSTANEQITYAFDNANEQITRAVGSGSAQILAEHISAFTFNYLDSAGAATTVSANIRQVSITITAKTAKPDPNFTSNGGYRTYTMSATITPGNLAL
ncbi:MAG TPA: prepilin-type N-terminal cleavage/methylation domain-containing protein [Candidatus Binatia bacterium]|nr:prepilin-type N-terminal cleavage/methylation domain-containing protein [Candidatus Binatia bacterium]